MASKLFRAIVGLGISVGASGAAAACSGGSLTVTNVQADGSMASDPSSSSPDPGTPAHEPEADATPDATAAADATVDDASAADAADAPADVILDAFCDATWPTTKGSGPTCGPTEGCVEAGHSPQCYPLLSPGVCSPTTTGTAAYCVNRTWQCSTGSVPQDECRCFGPLEAGATCQ